MNIKKIGTMPTEKELEGYVKQGIIPVRFCYPKEGGDVWHKLRRDKRYKLGGRELRAFMASIRKVKNNIGDRPINLVHLGPGDGIEIPFLFEMLKPGKNGRYAGVDISERMIQNTERLNRKYLSGIHPLWYLTDIETKGNLELICDDIKKKGAGRNLILLNNQGVLFSNLLTLENICRSMQEKDYLFITIEGDCPKKREEICRTYDLKYVRELLCVGLRRAGYNPAGGEFRTIFNEEKSMAEVYFRPENGEEILCLTSYKPKENEFRQRLEANGFSIDFMHFYEDVRTFGVLCRRDYENGGHK